MDIFFASCCLHVCMLDLVQIIGKEFITDKLQIVGHEIILGLANQDIKVFNLFIPTSRKHLIYLIIDLNHITTHIPGTVIMYLMEMLLI